MQWFGVQWIGGFGNEILFVAAGALLVALPLLIAAAVIERRQERRLAEAALVQPPVLLLTGDPGTGRALGPVAAGIALADPPLGQLMVKVRSFIGGRIELHERLVDRARREVLMRLREAARRQRADAVAGIRFQSVDLGGSSVALFAYGTALAGTGLGVAAGGAGLPGAIPPEALASPPPRGWRIFVALILGGVVAAMLGGVLSILVDLVFGDFINLPFDDWRRYG